MFKDIFTSKESDLILEHLHKELDYVPRKFMVFKIFGNELELPRDKQFYGDMDEDGNFPMYRYGSDWYPPVQIWTPTLKYCRDKIWEETGQYCNHCVVNRYRNGSDHIGYHHDKTPDFVSGSSVCTLSFGAERTFQVKNNKTGKVDSYQTKHGSLCILDWNTNKECKHRIMKTSKNIGERISLTFRSIQTVRLKSDNDQSELRLHLDSTT